MKIKVDYRFSILLNGADSLKLRQIEQKREEKERKIKWLENYMLFRGRFIATKFLKTSSLSFL